MTKVLDLADFLGDYKKTCEDASDGDLDWMHINTLQWLGDGQIINKFQGNIYHYED